MTLCLFCKQEAVYGDLCKTCWLGLKMFNRDVRLLGRAVAYLSPNKRQLKTKRERRTERKKIREVRLLKTSQWRDKADREVRFDHAISE
jgi:hypothetical protein